MKVFAAFLAILFQVTVWAAKPDPCNSAYHLQLKEAVESNREAILKAHLLPEDYTRGYYSRRIEPYLAKTRYPEIKNPKKLYRGMFLSVDALAEILEKGMALDKVTWQAVDGGVSFSSSIQEASTYIFHNGDDRGARIGVVFEVTTSGDMYSPEDAELNPTNTIFKLQRDLKPQEITELYVWGQYGLESLQRALELIQGGKTADHNAWTGVFSNGGGGSR
ncbi:MAG: hypothetical protein JST80_06380 [Bdellovibrionales bacterium]|nr:hypothetical protein [Bdellovibrionales bacterium]